MNTQQAGNVARKNESDRVWTERREEIEWLYATQGYSQAKVAVYFGITQAGLSLVMRRLGIQSRGRANPGSRNGRFKDGSQARGYRKVLVKDQCAICGTSKTLGIHHKNGDHYDNRLENLQVLCNPCHMSETKKLWWAAKKAGLPTPKSNGPVGWSRIASLSRETQEGCQ